jgi:small subunit ribosomal protein S20
VAHSISAKKRIRQNQRARARNRARKDSIKDSIKAFTAALAHGDFEKAKEALTGSVQKMDRIATKGTIHKNAAARKRSRLTKRLNAAIAAAKTKPEGAPTKTRGRGRAKSTGAGTST